MEAKKTMAIVKIVPQCAMLIGHCTIGVNGQEALFLFLNKSLV